MKSQDCIDLSPLRWHLEEMTQLDLQPTLVGTAITMRPLVPADWDALFAVAADPLIWAVHPAHDRWQQPVFRQFFAETLASGGALVAVDNASGAIIGHSRYDHGRAEPGEIEIGWTFLARSAWGGTSNAEMKRLMLGHALQSVERVVFLIGDTNYRSRRAMEKIGGVLTPRTQHTMLAGSPVTHLIYAIDRAGFATGPLAA
jgi:RimJ/RimL family protein N-acetyltransferase